MQVKVQRPGEIPTIVGIELSEQFGATLFFSFGKAIRKIRKEQSLTQEQLEFEADI